MRLHRIRLRGIGPFVDVDVDLDLDALPGPLVAVTGANGAGKTSLLQLGFAGALYRSTPTQGTLASRARGRDSLVEAHVGDLLIRHHVDAAGSGKVLVQRCRRPLVESGGARDFDRWAAQHLPAQDLFFASVFGAPGAAGFLGMTAADRKRVLLRALGIERYEVMARRAGEEGAAAQAKAEAVAERFAAERKGTVPVAAALEAVQTACASLAAAEELARAARTAWEDAQRSAAARELALVEARAFASRERDLIDRRLAALAAAGDARRRRAALAAALASAAADRALAAAVDACRARAEGLRRAVEAAEEHDRQEARLLGEEEAARVAVTDLERRRVRALADLSGRDAVREQAGRAAGLRTAVAAAEEAGRAAAQAAAEAERDSRSQAQAAAQAREVAREQRQRAARAEARIAALAGVEEAERRLAELRARAAETAAAQSAAEAEMERVRGLLVTGKDTRIQGLRGGLTLVRDEGREPGATASLLALSAEEALGEDDALAAEHAAAPEALNRAKEVVDAADEAAVQAERALRAAELLAERRPELDAARAERETALDSAERAEAEALVHEATAEDAQATATHQRQLAGEHAASTRRLRGELLDAERAERRLPELAAAEATSAGLDEQIVAARAAHEAAVGRVRALGEPPPRPVPEEVAEAEAACAQATTAAARLPTIAAAEATARVLDEQIARETAAIAVLDEQIGALGPAPAVPAEVDVGDAERAARAADRAAQEAAAVHARAEQGLAVAEAAAQRIAGLEEELRAAELVAADWALISRGLGRDGLQALEIDAAGPELTALVNELLRACFGSRYTVTIATTRAKKDGSGDREVCDVLVYDAQNPQDGDRDGREFSDGQRVILGEAIRGALSVLSCRRAGLRGVTLVRDEATGVLDAENAPAYVRMLRRLAEMVDASKVLFVTHDPALWALAEARVTVAGGKVAVETGLQQAA